METVRRRLVANYPNPGMASDLALRRLLGDTLGWLSTRVRLGGKAILLLISEPSLLARRLWIGGLNNAQVRYF
jgi:hypothetical protein